MKFLERDKCNSMEKLKLLYFSSVTFLLIFGGSACHDRAGLQFTAIHSHRVDRGNGENDRVSKDCRFFGSSSCGVNYCARPG